jgi:hypothetical protein
MSEGEKLASELLALWETLEKHGVDGETSVSAFTSAMWAKLVVRGMPASEDLMSRFNEVMSELSSAVSKLQTSS